MKLRHALALASSSLPLATLGGCGLTPHDESTPVFSSDGVTGFGMVGNVEFCIGRTRVVAPAVAAGAELALCVPDGATPRACEADLDCAPRERCSCGRCVVVACDTTGRGCAEGEVCQGGRCTTACTRDGECARDFVCRGGGCVHECATSTDCAYGELCDSLASTCRVSLCGGARGGCGSGQTCEPLEHVAEMREPFVLGSGAGERAYLTVAAGGTTVIYRARPARDLRWVADPETPVLEPGPASDLGSVGAPALLAERGGLTLYFETGGGTIERATSSDGVSFTRDAAPVLVATPDGWEAGRVGSPSVIVYRGETYLFYAGGAGAGIGAARVGASGVTRLTGAPLVSRATVEDPLFWRGVSAVGAPSAMVVEGAVRIFFTARGAEGHDAIEQGSPRAADVNDSIGLVTTRDFVSFERYPMGPVFARRTNLRAYLGEREPFLRRDGARTRLYFVTGDATGKASGVALAADPP
ncbi:MAG: hypothetical protein OZ921_14810 [Sorangiineae bacterium]|nr:hypothetical protein [Polyangiaceae bacterium]MEB2323780.1 hypothetical protein [Sorangiineae bacterium]